MRGGVVVVVVSSRVIVSFFFSAQYRRGRHPPVHRFHLPHPLVDDLPPDIESMLLPQPPPSIGMTNLPRIEVMNRQRRAPPYATGGTYLGVSSTSASTTTTTALVSGRGGRSGFAAAAAGKTVLVVIVLLILFGKELDAVGIVVVIEQREMKIQARFETVVSHCEHETVQIPFRQGHAVGGASEAPRGGFREYVREYGGELLPG
mmetsp:Transcript_40994/g.123695  ORF Transcript_40994/g.123695 Transcript_40994/m.123695 type:complete len:204 (-) Transcript_40994:414-1025(-)